MRSLQTRVVLLVLAGVSALWLVAAAAIWWDGRHELDELLDSHLAQAASLLVAQAAEGELEHQYEEAAKHARFDRRVAFQVWHEGRLQWRSANAPSTPMTQQNRGFATSLIDGKLWRVFATRGKASDVQLFVGERLDARADILLALLRGMLMPLAFGLPLLALIVWLAVWRGLQPLRALGAQLQRRSPADLAAIELADAPSEVQRFTRALNELFARIAGLIDNERRFTQDAAHELRTPIAAIRAQAQVAASARSPVDVQAALQKTLQGCDRASHLVDQLLQLARLDGTSDASPRPSSFDLVRTVAQVLAPLHSDADVKHITLDVDVPESCMMIGDEALTASLFRNLCDNALRYTPAGGRVRLRISENKVNVQAIVEDSGPGMTTEQIARLGERFFRVTGHEAEGSGLGWSIIRRIAAASGTSIEVERSAELGGLRVALTWPSANPSRASAQPVSPVGG